MSRPEQATAAEQVIFSLLRRQCIGLLTDDISFQAKGRDRAEIVCKSHVPHAVASVFATALAMKVNAVIQTRERKFNRGISIFIEADPEAVATAIANLPGADKMQIENGMQSLLSVAPGGRAGR